MPTRRPTASGPTTAGTAALVAAHDALLAQALSRIMGHVPQVDPELDAALRRLRAAFGFVEVLEVWRPSVGCGGPSRRA
jgi:hypothetical protein